MNSLYDHSFEIVWINSAEDLKLQYQLVDAFFALYEDPSCFPDPDEREDPRFIKERVAEGTSDPHTHLMAYLLISPTGARQFVAGCIVEFYPDCACGLVTYLFVKSAFRGVRIGVSGEKAAESLIQSEKGLAGLVHFFETSYGKRVGAVLFESNNPFQTSAGDDSMPPAKRLKFFSRMGAKRVDFNYVQPPLDDDKEVVTNLYLLCFPDLTGLRNSIPVTLVMGFVMELAKSLDRNKTERSRTCYGQENYRHDRKILVEVGHVQAFAAAALKLRGLSVGGRNILRDMYNELIARRVNDTEVALTTLPGAE